MEQATPQGIIEAIASEVRIDPVRLTQDATLASLDLSSLDMVSALFAIEDRFGIETSPEDVAQAVTLGDLVDLVMAKAVSA
jgi:acyl carrier protein